MKKITFNIKKIEKELIVIGCGMPGIVAAVQAARLGLTVALINDRGYIGGNASAEIRKQIDGANSVNEFIFYSQEGGILHELLLENLKYNPQGNFFIWDAVLRDFLYKEKNIELFLHTCVDEVNMQEENKIKYVSGSQQGSETRFNFFGKYFLDDTGDGTIGYLSRAEYRMGREGKLEFNESIAPSNSDSSVLPSTLPFFAKDTGELIDYKPPRFAMNIKEAKILENRKIRKDKFYTYQWYYALDGRLNQIKESQRIIKRHYELVFGIWDYIKNSGEYNSKNYDLEYVSSIPGKRESRRLIGDYILNQNDIVNQKIFEDAVGYGGRGIDLHAIDGIFSKEEPNRYYLLKGIYQIPYRCGYSKNIENLFFAGRNMSTTHVAFGSTRVMATLCTLGQALGAAAFLCLKKQKTPRGLYESNISDLQQLLIKEDNFIPGIKNKDKYDKCRNARINVSSIKKMELTNKNKEINLKNVLGLIVPVLEKIKNLSLLIKTNNNYVLRYRVYEPDSELNWSPDNKILEEKIKIDTGNKFEWVPLSINKRIKNKKIFVEIFSDNSGIKVGLSEDILPGVISLEKQKIKSLLIYDANTLKRKSYMWQEILSSICFRVDPDQRIYGPENINNGFNRPYGLPNLWISDGFKNPETINIEFNKITTISQLILYFDADFNIDFIALPQTISGLRSRDERRIKFLNVDTEEELFCKARKLNTSGIKTLPTLVKDYIIYADIKGNKKKIAEVKNNYQRVNKIFFEPIRTDSIEIQFIGTNGNKSVRVFEVRAY